MISPTFANRILDHFLRDGVFVSLHSGDPGETGAHELTGRGYGRAAIGEMLAANGGLKLNARAIEFENLPKAEISHVGYWDAQRAGVFLGGEKLGDKRIVFEGDRARFEKEQLGFAID